MNWLLLIIKFVIFATVIGAPVYPPLPIESVLDYLRDFNYLTMGSGSESMISKAITDFQMEFGLNITGDINQETLQAMGLPRCKMSNVMSLSMGKRMKNFQVFPTTPKTRIFTWTVEKLSDKLDKDFQYQSIERGLKKWEDKCDVFFRRSNKANTHIKISFVSYDGVGKVLAFAFYPGDTNSGVQIIDNYENWGNGTGNTINLPFVFTHETGHTLGFMHSSDKNSVMYPSYVNSGSEFSLGTDDENVCHLIFGKKRSSCFSSDDTVLLKDGRSITLKELEIGDVVKTSKDTYSPIVSMLHRSEKEEDIFIQLKTKKNNSIKITKKHLIAVKSNLNDKMVFRFAGKLLIGDRLYYVNDNDEVEDEIIEIRREVMKGIFAPLTFDGKIIVNNIQASCYAEIEHEQLAHWSMLPLRVISFVKNLLYKSQSSDYRGIHWYGQFTKDYCLSMVQKIGLFN